LKVCIFYKKGKFRKAKVHFFVKPEHKETALNKRYLPIGIVCGVFVLVLVGNFARQAPSNEIPVRLRLENKGGSVVFTHARHIDYVKNMGKDCAACHHDMPATQKEPLPCGACHATEFNTTFSAAHQRTLPKESCTKCHHAEMGTIKYDHDAHANNYASACTDCHHSPDIEAEPQACKNCHGPAADGAAPALRDAAHARCQSCHEDMYSQKLAGCNSCHNFLPGTSEAKQPPCASCHYESDTIPLPARMDSFHGQCMQCHEQAGKGPFGDKSCKRCHTR
jgi:hypothetical protein